MNTRKHTALIRSASLALVVLDAYTLTRYPSPATCVTVWLLASFALVVAFAPNKSRFSL